MIATDNPYIDDCFLVDCADHPGRVVTFTIETGHRDSGFYHNSITALLHSATTNIEFGFCEEAFKGVDVNRDLFAAGNPAASGKNLSFKLAYHGFVADGPTPPRLSGWPTRSWDFRF